MGELLATVSARELTEWMAYDRIEPLGESRADIRAGQVCSTIYNVMGGGKSKPTDFMLFIDRDAPQDEGPLLDADPEVQSQLIMAAVFGIPPEKQ